MGKSDGLWWLALFGYIGSYTGCWLSSPSSKRLTQFKDIIQMCLQLHTSQECFFPQIFFENTVLNSLLWNSLVLCLHSNLGYPAVVCQALCLVVLATWASLYHRGVFDRACVLGHSSVCIRTWYIGVESLIHNLASSVVYFKHRWI